MSDEVTFEFDGERYGFNPAQMSVLEAIELKKLTGYTYMEWTEQVQQFDGEAFRFLVWVTLCRAGRRPEGKYSAFDFDMAGVMATFDAPEVEVEPDPTPPRKRGTSESK